MLEIGGMLEIVTADRGIFRSGTPLIHVLDGGVLRKTATGGGFIDPALDNDGLVEATAGTFELNNGSGGETSTGTFGGAGPRRASRCSTAATTSSATAPRWPARRGSPAAR